MRTDSSSSNIKSYFLPPSWLLVETSDRLYATNLYSEKSLELEGVVRADVLAGCGKQSNALRVLAKFDEDARAFIDGLPEQKPIPLTRHQLLRGTHYEILFVELTARCNEACLHCYAESSPKREETLSWEVLRQVIQDAHALEFRTIQFTGGDPLISPHFLSAVEYARSLDFPTIEIYTNGLALEGALWENIKSLPLDYAFSFYASDPTIHDAVTRTPGSHRRTLSAIKRVMQAGKNFRIGVVALELNRDCINETVSFLVEQGVPADVIAVGEEKGVGRGDSLAGLESGERPDATDVRKADKGGVEYGRYEEGLFVGKAAVSASGAVYPCIFSRDLLLGDVNSHRLIDVLNGMQMDGSNNSVGGEDLLIRARKEWDRLACWECRMRSVLLKAAAT